VQKQSLQKQPLQIQNERWQALELSFKSTQHSDNPYQDVELDIHFTAPDGSVLTMPGFWYGEDIWKVRFAAPTVGAWRYQSVCSNPSSGVCTLEQAARTALKITAPINFV
jgi:Domain of unknown function (DUF5060)